MVVKGKNTGYKLYGKLYHCPMDITMDYIGGKWKTVVLMYLKKDPLRFKDLKSNIPGITEKMLSMQLKALEADGLINREVLSKKPPLRVEYSLTPFGRTLIPALDAISRWGKTLGENSGKEVRF